MTFDEIVAEAERTREQTYTIGRPLVPVLELADADTVGRIIELDETIDNDWIIPFASESSEPRDTQSPLAEWKQRQEAERKERANKLAEIMADGCPTIEAALHSIGTPVHLVV